LHILGVDIRIQLLLTGLDLKVIFNNTVYVCLCRAASDRDVEAAIDDGARTVDEVGEACGAGTGCGACRPMIHEMLEASGLSTCVRESGRCADCPATRIPVALRHNGDSREAA
jgi:bacterioferritin-associated ferredoxin